MCLSGAALPSRTIRTHLLRAAISSCPWCTYPPTQNLRVAGGSTSEPAGPGVPGARPSVPRSRAPSTLQTGHCGTTSGSTPPGQECCSPAEGRRQAGVLGGQGWSCGQGGKNSCCWRSSGACSSAESPRDGCVFWDGASARALERQVPGFRLCRGTLGGRRAVCRAQHGEAFSLAAVQRPQPQPLTQAAHQL